jgi:hypothetical protein
LQGLDGLHPFFVLLAHSGDVGVDLFAAPRNVAARGLFRPDAAQDFQDVGRCVGRRIGGPHRDPHPPGRQVRLAVQHQRPVGLQRALHFHPRRAHRSPPSP